MPIRFSASSAPLVVALLLTVTLGGCAADTADDGAGTEASTGTETTGQDGAEPDGAPTGDLSTQAGGGTVQVTGEYTATLGFDSVWCQFVDGELLTFYAPYGPQSSGTFDTPDDGVFLEGFPTSSLVIGFDAGGTGGFTAVSGPTANGTTLDFDGVEILVSTPDQGNRSATVTGSLTCTHIERL